MKNLKGKHFILHTLEEIKRLHKMLTTRYNSGHANWLEESIERWQAGQIYLLKIFSTHMYSWGMTSRGYPMNQFDHRDYPKVDDMSHLVKGGIQPNGERIILESA